MHAGGASSVALLDGKAVLQDMALDGPAGRRTLRRSSHTSPPVNNDIIGTPQPTDTPTPAPVAAVVDGVVCGSCQTVVPTRDSLACESGHVQCHACFEARVLQAAARPDRLVVEACITCHACGERFSEQTIARHTSDGAHVVWMGLRLAQLRFSVRQGGDRDMQAEINIKVGRHIILSFGSHTIPFEHYPLMQCTCVQLCVRTCGPGFYIHHHIQNASVNTHRTSITSVISVTFIFRSTASWSGGRV